MHNDNWQAGSSKEIQLLLGECMQLWNNSYINQLQLIPIFQLMFSVEHILKQI